MAKYAFYAVRKGFKPGVYTTWEDCQKQTDGFKGAEYKGFKLLTEAKIYAETSAS